MLKNRNAYRRSLARLVLVGLLLRIAVPAGFMPTTLDDGWFLKLCPDGMPMSVMMALLGHDHHHHGEEPSPYQQCDLGGGLADAISLPDLGPTASTCLASSDQALGDQPAIPTRALAAFQARAPPPSRTS